MAIIISKKGSGPAQIVDTSQFAKEDSLQEFLQQHPESVPIYDIQESKRLFVAAREFPTDSGPIDALGLDKDGDIYIIETKLYRNPDKRTVVAQALDYGASLWKRFGDSDRFQSVLEHAVDAKWKIGLEAKLAEVFSHRRQRRGGVARSNEIECSRWQAEIRHPHGRNQ